MRWCTSWWTCLVQVIIRTSWFQISAFFLSHPWSSLTHTRSWIPAGLHCCPEKVESHMSSAEGLGPTFLPERLSWWNPSCEFFKAFLDVPAQQVPHPLSSSSPTFSGEGMRVTESVLTASKGIKLILQFAPIHALGWVYFSPCKLHLLAEPCLLKCEEIRKSNREGLLLLKIRVKEGSCK